MREVIIQLQVLNLPLRCIGKMQDEFQAMIGDQFTDDAHFYLIFFEEDVFLLEAASAQPHE